MNINIAELSQKPHGFGSDNPNWAAQQTLNQFFILNTQNRANDMLRVKGFLTLNSVYEMLGFEETEEGALAGWTKGASVDFGLLRHGTIEDDTKPFTLTFNVNSVNVFRDK